MATTTMERRDRGPVGARTSLRQQAWLLWRSRRWAFLVLAFMAVLMLIALGDVPPEVPDLLIVAFVLLPVAPIWAMVVWLGEGPDRRSYHWSLPVSRPVHDLARVTLGAAYLVAGYAVLAGAGAVAASAGGVLERFTDIGLAAWAGFFLGPLILYLLVTPAVLWGDHPATRWVLGIVAGVPTLAVLFQWLGTGISLEPVVKVVFVTTRYSLSPALLDGIVDEMLASMWVEGAAGSAGNPWLTATAVWLSLGVLLTVLAAVFRPADLKRSKGRRRVRRMDGTS